MESLQGARRNNDACVAQCSRLVRTGSTRKTEKQAAKTNTYANDDASDDEDCDDGRKQGERQKTKATAEAKTKRMRKSDKNIASRTTMHV